MLDVCRQLEKIAKLEIVTGLSYQLIEILAAFEFSQLALQ
jgi:hypothetical protein